MDPILEITEFADRAVKQGGPALLFEKPKGYNVPVLINALRLACARWRSRSRWSRWTRWRARIVEFLEMRMPEGLIGKLKMLPKLAEMGAFFPKIVSKGAVPGSRAARTASRCSTIPVLQCWPEDGGRFITLPLVFSRNPDTGKRNCGMYRMQVYDERTTGMHWQTHKQGAEHYRRMQHQGTQAHGRRRRDRRRPGHHVLGHSAAAARSRRDDDRRLPARQSPVEMVKCQTCDLEVPANAEIVLEGYVELGELRTEGPFGDHTGFYSLADEYPVFHVTCVTQRKDPIYATTIVGPPPMEDFYMGKAIERIFLPLMRLQLPEVRDIAMPAEGVFHNLILVSIRKSYPGHARKVMHAIWGTRPGDVLQSASWWWTRTWTCRTYSEVAWKALNNIDPRARHPVRDGPGGFAGSRQPPAELRLEDGHRRHAQVARRRLHAALAGRDRDVGRGPEARWTSCGSRCRGRPGNLLCAHLLDTIGVLTVGVAQLVERRIVVPVAEGSNPSTHPNRTTTPACDEVVQPAPRKIRAFGESALRPNNLIQPEHQNPEGVWTRPRPRQINN